MTATPLSSPTAGTAPVPLRVGIVGLGWMGQVHARAYARVAQHYLDLPVRPRLVAVADNAGDRRVRAAAAAYGIDDLHADWADLVARDDIDVVSVTGPNFIHRDVSVAVAESGKHLWVEKPAGRTAAETREIAAAVAKAGVQSAAGFNYRNAPAVEQARRLVSDGRLGRITTVTVRFLADYAAHPQGALTWRYQNAWSGSGVLGDLGSHAVDLALYVAGAAAGEITDLVADTAITIAQRPKPSGATFAHSARGGGELGPVENEDQMSALVRFADGARGFIEASRTAVGEQCTYTVEVHGERGALAWDFRRMGELRICLDQEVVDAGWTTIFVPPGTGELSAFQPGSGIAMSYDDLKVIEAQRLITSIATGTPVGATIADAVVAADLVEAMLTSVQDRRWVSL